ncbi:MAG: DNA-processing protein DprA [Alphaproteobacteria bacterium]
MPHHEQSLNQAERLDWLRLIRSENVGPITFFHLLRYYGSAGAALDALPELARRGGKRAIKVFPAALAKREVAAIEQAGASLLAHGEADYPKALAAIDDAPPLITLKGNVHLLAKPMIAVVGARNASGNGKRQAARLAAELGEAGIVVVSGLARGIDASAHKAALGGGTVGVVAGGIDIRYPKENAELQDDIAERGVLLAESPFGVQPVARHFPRRNRIISGLSQGVVIVEAAPRSGSLITARMALEQGREVFASPGSPLDPRARGANNLIRQGATLTETAKDIVDVVCQQIRTPLKEPREPKFREEPPRPPSEGALREGRQKIIESLSASPIPVDELIRECQVSAALLAVVLLELELAGRIERHPGGQVSLMID